MSLEQLITTYGYAAIGIGTFFEGETILILGGLAAHLGYLQLPWVIFSAFLGSMFGDQLFFYIGRIKGTSFLDKRPHWKAKADKAFRLLNAYQTWLILGFRFLYGLRTVTPFIIGAGRISPLRFLILNIIGALTWAAAIGGLGYQFGKTLEVIIGDVKKFEVVIFLSMGGIGLMVWVWGRWKAKR